MLEIATIQFAISNHTSASIQTIERKKEEEKREAQTETKIKFCYSRSLSCNVMRYRFCTCVSVYVLCKCFFCMPFVQIFFFFVFIYLFVGPSSVYRFLRWFCCFVLSCQVTHYACVFLITQFFSIASFVIVSFRFVLLSSLHPLILSLPSRINKRTNHRWFCYEPCIFMHLIGHLFIKYTLMLAIQSYNSTAVKLHYSKA